MKFYRKQPLEAEQFDGSQKLVFGYSVIPSGLIDAITEKPAYYSMLVDDVCQDSDDDTGVVLEAGDWIVKEADEIEVIADDVFKQTYVELPAIPKAVAAYIKKCKHDGIAIASAMDEDKFPKKVADYFRNYYTRDQWIELQDTFVRAWLDGYQVED